MGLAFAVVGSFLLLNGAPAQPPNKEAGTLSGNAASGKRLFNAYHCYACHGYTGETGTAPHLNPMPLGQAAFIAYLRSPSTNYRDNESVYGVMPPYAADDVTDQDLADVYAYIKALPSSSPPLKSIGLLNSAN